MTSQSSSLLVIGGGITGLCLAVAAQARGISVDVVAKDPVPDTASGVAAGMIAPALEALGEHEPEAAYPRLRRAQQAWLDLMEAWPQEVREALTHAQAAAHSRYVWYQSDNLSDITTPRLKAMNAPFTALTDAQLTGIAGDMDGVRVTGDWLLNARTILDSLQAHLLANGGGYRQGTVAAVTATQARLDSGEVMTADHVVVAAGYGAGALASSAPVLGSLAPIKGHLLDLKGQGGQGVVRWSGGYLADHGASAKFGATMQFGQDDTGIEPAVVDDLKARAKGMLPDIDLTDAHPRAGVRASTPDAWPLIGRDRSSGVYVATGMRRNGYIFAPYAAQLILALISGGDLPEDAALYDPDRF